MLNIIVDNEKFQVEEGTSVLEACRKAGKTIPTLCYLKDIQAIGACRVCLVEVKGQKDLVASCTMPVSEGMDITTTSQRVRQARRLVVELLLSEHDGDCQTCDRKKLTPYLAVASKPPGIRISNGVIGYSSS